jgi:hypothetical protein
MESIGAAMPGVGFLIGGVIVQFSSPRTAYTVAGIGVMALVVAAALLKPAYERGVRHEVVGLTPRRRPAAPSDGA